MVGRKPKPDPDIDTGIDTGTEVITSTNLVRLCSKMRTLAIQMIGFSDGVSAYSSGGGTGEGDFIVINFTSAEFIVG